MKKTFLFFVAVCVSTAALGFAQEGLVSASAGVASGSVAVSSPKMTISNEKPDPSLLLKEGDFVQPSFRDSDPEIPFPSRARLDKIYDGQAAVGVMLDAEGNATDFLVVRHTKQDFSQRVMDVIRHEKYSPRIVKNTPVPGRFFVVRTFSIGYEDPVDMNRPMVVGMNAMEQMGAMSSRVSEGGRPPKLTYKAHEERELDGHILKIIAVDTPVIPAEYELQPNQVLKVIVSFYVDEKGNVRLPNVDSDAPAPVVTSVIKTVSNWKFAPPTIKKKPALVFTNRTLTLESKMPPSESAESIATSKTGK
ncbi:MAG: energy transducer TonB [Verrucomicrobia bacterium]|nr:energy transducer TonB [Verrucomicrobiota bacterium]